MKKNPETAIMVNAIDLLRPEQLRFRGYDRLYVGSEFCPNKMPLPETMKEIPRIFPGPLTLVTPPLGRGGLEMLTPRIEAAMPRKGPLEVVVNDWGLLRFLKGNRRTKLFLGRLLMAEIGEMDKDLMNSFCRQYRVSGVEVDTEEAVQRLHSYNGAVHFHYPYRLKSASRYCSYIRDFNHVPCSMDCGSVFIQMSQRAESYPVFMRGNAYFIPNRPVKHTLITRLVRSFI